MQGKVEEDLKMQVSSLAKKLNATLVGCRSENKMYGESFLKVMEYERIAGELQNKAQELRTENTELRDQLFIALEHQTTKSSTGSLGSELGEARDDKPPSSGIGSDLKDSETYDSEHSSMWSSSYSPDKLFSKSGAFDLITDCAEQHLKKIASLTEEVVKLNAFRDLFEKHLVKTLFSDSLLDGKEQAEGVSEDNKEEVPQASLTALEIEIAELTEEKCELEEAENDSTLRAQVAERKLLKMRESL